MRPFKRLVEWIEQRRYRRSLVGRLTDLQRKLVRLEYERLRVEAEVQLQKTETEEQRVRYDRAMQRLQDSLEKSELFVKRQKEAIDALNDQLQTATELTIPTLVAAHQLVLNRFEHESQILAMRNGAMVAASQGNNEG